MRLDKFVCKSTEHTKAQATELIHDGQLRVNGEEISNEAAQVHENNTITLNGELLKARPFRYLLMHKPLGTICSNVDEGYPSLFNSLEIDKVSELHVAGRLDVDTTGLVLITDDGRWTYDIITPSKNCQKVYRIGLSRDLSKGLIDKFKEGLQLQGESQLTLPADLQVLSQKEARLTITEGKYHQVKRMFTAIGNRVTSLHREKIGEIPLNIPLDQWRYLTNDEVKSFARIT
ncbi:pseudouridine synthase [Rubritalea profundi]|uniref:Pseudouridine synthase n=1 Tax=Rubritalea profundi TaxID=1658618 RepID=A0A2S7TZ38_9BACT|nr:pseudouridine synthase [Rubritalea profundi]PQJ28009.1 16S rRNA pseudouridine(516) synthase [Rubritalea profundi]